MDAARALALLGLGALAGVAVWIIAGRLDHDPVLNALIAWANDHTYTTSGDGRRRPISVVGTIGPRLFTVTYQAGAPTLLVALDCEAKDGQTSATPSAAVTQDGALVTRWTKPTPAHIGRLDEVLAAMVEVAEGLERDAPGDAEVE